MFSILPELFFLSPLATTLLRISAGIVFFILAWNHWQRRDELGKVKFIVVGSGEWICILAAVVELLIALGLIFGVMTQGIAIAGAIAAIKYFIWQRRYGQFFPLSRVASALLFVICLSLIVTGAGAFAFDLPL